MTYVFKYSVADVENMTPFEAEVLYYMCVEFEQKKQQAQQNNIN